MMQQQPSMFNTQQSTGMYQPPMQIYHQHMQPGPVMPTKLFDDTFSKSYGGGVGQGPISGVQGAIPLVPGPISGVQSSGVCFPIENVEKPSDLNVNIQEIGDVYHIACEVLQTVNPNTLQVTSVGHTVTITGDVFGRGRFERIVTFARDIDNVNIRARLAGNLLEIDVPRRLGVQAVQQWQPLHQQQWSSSQLQPSFQQQSLNLQQQPQQQSLGLQQQQPLYQQQPYQKQDFLQQSFNNLGQQIGQPFPQQIPIH